jgi:hypothetical protein
MKIPPQILEEDYRRIAQHKELLAMEARRQHQLNLKQIKG